MFPLHHQEELKRLSFSWYQRVKISLQPLGEELLGFCVCSQEHISPTNPIYKLVGAIYWLLAATIPLKVLLCLVFFFFSTNH